MSRSFCKRKAQALSQNSNRIPISIAELHETAILNSKLNLTDSQKFYYIKSDK